MDRKTGVDQVLPDKEERESGKLRAGLPAYAEIKGLSFGAFLGDRAYDADWLRSVLHERGVEMVIPARAKRLQPAPHDTEKYK